ncbi:MAG: amidohydrolase family protein [Chloroflexota bacterium]
MIIDVHIHYVGGHPAPHEHQSFMESMEAMLRMGRKLGIERQVLLSMRYGPEADALLRETADRFPGEVIPFMRGSFLDPACPANIERGVREYGFKGVKLYDELPELPLEGLVAGYPIYLKAAELGVPVLIHAWHPEEGLTVQASEMLGYAYFPARMIEALGQRYPATQFIIAHAGGLWIKAFQAAQPYPNIYFDVSGFDPERGIVEAGVAILGAERILFGSDVPGRSYAAQLAKVQAAEISARDKTLILGENAAALLGLR